MIEIPSAYVHEHRKARKAHMTIECQGRIEPGEKYHCHHGIWDGVPSAFKVCEDCQALRNGINAEVPHDDSVAFGCLMEHVAEVPELLARYAAIMRKRRGSVPAWIERALQDGKTEKITEKGRP
jgi:hypothetical protein